MPGVNRTTKLPYLMRQPGRGGKGEYFYYRRDGRTERLPGPEGSAAFLEAYDRIHTGFEGGTAKHTVGAAIQLYLDSADYRNKSEATKRNYEFYLKEMRNRAGHLELSDITVAWVERLRDALADDPHRWNRLKSLMFMVTKRYGRMNPDAMITLNPWDDAERLALGDSDQNRAWPQDVLVAIMRAATPEFRALVRCLLLTGQRLADVCALRPDQYDPVNRTLGVASSFAQQKTGTGMALHVPDDLAVALDAMRGRRSDRLLVTPRGEAWSPYNARETLQGLRTRLGLERYTLHGLRATGPTALAQAGVDLSIIMSVTGHRTEAELRRYLKGVERYPLAKAGQEGIANAFQAVLTQSLEGANTRSYAGVTGRAAARSGVQGRSSRPKVKATS